MAKDRKTGGKAAKSSGSNTPLLLGLLAVGGFFLLKSNSASAEPSGPTNSGAGYNNDPMAPNSVPVTLPPGGISVPASVPTPAATTLPAYAQQAIAGMMSTFGLDYGQVLLLIEADSNAAHNGGGKDVIYQWLAEDIQGNGQRLLNAYGRPIPTIAGTTSQHPTSPGTTAPATQPPTAAQTPFLDNWGTPHRTLAHAQARNNWPAYEGPVHRAMWDTFRIFSESTEILIARDVESNHPGESSPYETVYRWLASDIRTNGQALLDRFGSDVVPNQ